MNIKLGFDKTAAIMLLGMVIFFVAGTSIAGYDAGAEDFGAELQRAASTKANVNIFVFTMSGLGFLGAAAGLIAAFREKSPALSTLCGIGLIATGVLVLISTALYAAFARLADEYVTSSGPAADQAMSNARIVLLIMSETTVMTAMLGGASIWGIAILAAIRGLVPRWFGVFPVASAVALAFSGVTSQLVSSDFFPWLGIMIMLVGSALWLVLTAGWLVMGGNGSSSKSDATESPTSDEPVKRRAPTKVIAIGAMLILPVIGLLVVRGAGL